LTKRVGTIADPRHITAYDCQARAALRSTLWSIPSRKRIGLGDVSSSPGALSADVRISVREPSLSDRNTDLTTNIDTASVQLGVASR
jgi:hypothetical protein